MKRTQTEKTGLGDLMFLCYKGEKGRKGTNGGRNLETLVKLAAPAIGTAAGAFTVVGIIYLGMTLAGLLRGGGGEIRKAVAIIVAGLTCIAFAHLYGY